MRLPVSEKLELERRISEAKSSEWGYSEGHLLEWVEKRIAMRLEAEPSSKVRVLDWGAGEGKAVEKAGGLDPRVESWGLTLRKPKGKKPLLAGRLVLGQFETRVFPGYFDLIQMRFSQQHANNHALALENALNSLRPGGEIIVPADHLYALRKPYRQPEPQTSYFYREATEDNRRLIEKIHPEVVLFELLEETQRQGFRVEHHPSVDFGPLPGTFLERRPLDAVVIRRVTEKTANLRRFYGHPTMNRFPVLPK